MLFLEGTSRSDLQEQFKRPLAAEARPGHVAADDEVGGTEILPDDHVLDGFPGPSHLHGVREVRPPEVLTRPLLVLGLLLQDFIGLDSRGPVDVAGLGRATGRVHEHDGVVHILVGMNLRSSRNQAIASACLDQFQFLASCSRA